jgi:hypothetical protein
VKAGFMEISTKIPLNNFFKGNIELINNFIMALTEEQIKEAFE